MSETAIAGIISLVGIFISALTSLSLVNWRLAALEKKVDEHNGWGERFYQQTTDIALIRQDIKSIKENMNHE